MIENEKIATIEVHRKRDMQGGRESYRTVCTVHCDTPFGKQGITTAHESAYAYQKKTLYGSLARFQKHSNEGVRECLKRFVKGMKET